jgi:hypothetical protein
MERRQTHCAVRAKVLPIQTMLGLLVWITCITCMDYLYGLLGLDHGQ